MSSDPTTTSMFTEIAEKFILRNTEVWLFAMFIDSFASEGPK